MFLVLIGTKAQLIKMAPVMLAMTKADLSYRFVLTGQHRETMSDLIDQFDLPKPEFLVPLEESDTKAKLMFWVLRAMWRAVFNKGLWRGTRYCLVHGDTLSTLLGALSARIHGKKVIHVEAGLRSFNIRHPFPEELTRILVTKLSQYYYCADQWGVDNVNALVKRSPENVLMIGNNTLLDALYFALSKGVGGGAKATRSDYCVVSVHRYENLTDRARFDKIMEWVEHFATKMDVKIVLHPATKKVLVKSGWYGRLKKNTRIDLLPRMGYCEFIALLDHSVFLASDGGSNQEECSYIDLPCLLFRDATERNEGLESNVVLSGLDDAIINRFLDNLDKVKKERSPCVPNELSSSPSHLIAKHLKNLVHYNR
jgi:UDP-N-acetylglucosamine 2-epimerase (non-hydrolysing)